jgi:hypothetical protein
MNIVNDSENQTRKSSLNEIKNEGRISLDITNTKTSFSNSNSRPSFISLKHKLSDKIFFPEERTDAFGNKIIKGSKTHKLSFIDEISREKIAQVIIIDSSYTKNNLNKEECKCETCNIF